MPNPYETLGVASDAGQDDIRKAYRKAAKETHPDLNPGNPDAEKRFKEISAAYDIIGDAEKRKRYDAGEIDETGAERKPERHYYREYAEADPGTRYSRRAGPFSAGQNAGQTTGQSSWQSSSANASDFDADIFADLFRGRGGERTTFRMPPQDVEYTLDVDFLDAAKGARKTLSMPDGKTLDVTIPAGISDGKVLRLKGQGLPGSDGKTGDAHIHITIRPHPAFERDGYDVVSTLPVSLGEALNGATVRAETIDGPVDVKVPKGAKDGAKLRLRGKGIARGKDGTRGDQFVKIHIVLPEGADDALAHFMAEWEKTHPQNPRGKGAA